MENRTRRKVLTPRQFRSKAVVMRDVFSTDEQENRVSTPQLVATLACQCVPLGSGGAEQVGSQIPLIRYQLKTWHNSHSMAVQIGDQITIGTLQMRVLGPPMNVAGENRLVSILCVASEQLET